MMRLYHVPLSPFCRMVRLVLAEKKLEVELVEEKYWERDADFLRRNPAGKVPVLKADGFMLAEVRRPVSTWKRCIQTRSSSPVRHKNAMRCAGS